MFKLFNVLIGLSIALFTAAVWANDNNTVSDKLGITGLIVLGAAVIYGLIYVIYNDE